MSNSETPNMKQVIVTTSWDDGHRLDMRLSALLEKYHIKATFYISPRDHEFARQDRLTDEQIEHIGRMFEIGAHTMTHPRLTEVSDTTARQEILDSKQYLERLLKRPINTFCYPGGNYRAKHVAMVHEAGFLYARTVKRHGYTLKGSMLEATTSANTYNHFQDLWKIAKFARFNPIRTYRYFQWDVLAKAQFDKVHAEGGVFHLWGHSWEVEKFDYWARLEEVLRYISNRENVTYATNSELPTLRPKNLLITAPYFPPHLGGVEFYVYYMAKQLQDVHGWKVAIATSGGKGFRMLKTTYEGLTVYRLPYWLRLSNTPLNPFWPRMLQRISLQEDIYLINAHAPVPGIADLSTLIAAHLHIPVVLTYHMLSMAKGRAATDRIIYLYERNILPKTLKYASAIICASDPIRDVFLQSYRHKSITITPGVDVLLFRPAKKLPRKTLLFVGSLARSDTHKGVAVLLKAMKRVVQECPDARLLLAGQGDGRPDFEALARRYGIASQVTFLGGRYGPDLYETYREATAFVLPTFNDSFAMVVLEALASGLPVVSTPVGAIPMQVADGVNGYLVKPGDAEALAEKLIYLLQHQKVAETFGARGRERSQQGFSWETKATATNQLFLQSLYGMNQGES